MNELTICADEQRKKINKLEKKSEGKCFGN